MAVFYCYKGENEYLMKKGGAGRKIYTGGDKSVTHRAIMLAAMAKGVSVIKNPSRSKDCMATAALLENLGVSFEYNQGANTLVVKSPGIDFFETPVSFLDCANSGTTARLACGLLSSVSGRNYFLAGDASLSKRPMDRVCLPLEKMGARFIMREGRRLPLAIAGGDLKGIDFENIYNSAQVKSAVILAALSAAGETRIVEKIKTRDHLELMAAEFGLNIGVKESENGEYTVTVKGGQRPSPSMVEVPEDISTAAFYIAFEVLAAALYGGNLKMELKNVLINRTRAGFLESLETCGIEMNYKNSKKIGGEKAADVSLAWKKSQRLEIKPLMTDQYFQTVSMIDEIPALSLVLCFAGGESVLSGLAELRLKETDRLYALTTELKKMGALIRTEGDSLFIDGIKKFNGAKVKSYGDHRIAMTLIIAGILSNEDFELEDCECVNVSNPKFFEELSELGIKYHIQ